MNTQVWTGRTKSPLSRGRQLVLVDIENLVGGACLTDGAVRSAKEALVATGQIGVVHRPADTAKVSAHALEDGLRHRRGGYLRGAAPAFLRELGPKLLRRATQ